MTTMQIAILPVSHLAKLILILLYEIIEQKKLPTCNQLALLCKVKHREVKQKVQELQRDNLVWYVKNKWIVPADIAEDKLSACMEISKLDIPEDITIMDFCKNNDKKVHVPQKVDEEDKYADIAFRWNLFVESYPKLQRVDYVTVARADKLAIAEKDKRWDFEKILAEISMSQFLQGFNNRQWRVTFDWIISKKDNWLKILEGKYRDRTIIPTLPNTGNSGDSDIY